MRERDRVKVKESGQHGTHRKYPHRKKIVAKKFGKNRWRDPSSRKWGTEKKSRTRAGANESKRCVVCMSEWVSVCVREYIMYPVHCTGVSFGLLFFLYKRKKMLYIYLMWHQHQHQQRQHHSMCTCILRLRLRNTLTCLISLPSFIFFAYFFIPFSVSLSLWFFFQTSPAHFFYMFNGCPFRIHTAHVPTVKKNSYSETIECRMREVKKNIPKNSFPLFQFHCNDIATRIL